VCFRDAERRVFAFKRWNDDGQVALVLVNLKHESTGALTLSGLENGPWRERTCDYDVEVNEGKLEEQLGPSEVKLFTKA